MITPMQRVALLCTASAREEALARLQDLGILHVDAAAAEEPSLKEAQSRLDEALAALNLLRRAQEEAKDTKQSKRSANAEGVEISIAAITHLGSEAAALSGELAALEAEIARYTPFGDFEPGDARALQAAGMAVRLFKAPQEALPSAQAGGLVKLLRSAKGFHYGVMIGECDYGERLELVPLPERPLAALAKRRQEANARLAAIEATLATMATAAHKLDGEIASLTEERDFLAARAAMASSEGIIWLTGFCPAERLDALRAAAKEMGWGLVAREPLPEENPPTLIKQSHLFQPITALFKMLGIAPGYRESDVSVVFYAFFTLFFAMLVGDAGYGLLMLIVTRLLRLKMRRASSTPFTLMTVFSLATFAWGVMSCTYFGIHTELLPEVLNHPLAQWLNEQSNIMQLCFLLGAIHLSIARLWNAALLWPHTKALAEIGWVGVIWTMYHAACLVVVTNFVFPPFMYGVAIASILLIALFMLERKELKSEGINLAMLPLNIIGSLGDIISYVRLFAVGLASVKVAENFNDMAFALPLPLWAKIPAVALILLLGHGLNLAMGALSILVHAIRLNTLEFSNHKGVGWSGFDYRPFRRQQIPVEDGENLQR